MKIGIRIMALLLIAVNSFAQNTDLVQVQSFPDIESELEGNYLIHPFEVKYVNSKYYVADGRDACVKVFSEKGDFIRQIGRSGQGPGEMLGVFEIAMNEKDEILLTNDAGNGRISAFASDGSFINVIRSIKSFQAIEYLDGNIYVQSFNSALKSNFAKYDSSGAFANSFGEFFDDNVNNTLFAKHLYGADLISENDHIYAVYTKIPFVDKFDKSGNLVKRVRLKIKKFQEHYDKNIKQAKIGYKSNKLYVTPFTNGSVIDNETIYYLVRTKPTEIKIFAVNLNGELERIIAFRGGLPLPIMYRLVGKKDEQFIFSDYGNAQIKLYRESRLGN